MERRILFNLADPEEARVAILEDGRLAELAFESAERRSLRGDIILGRVARIEPSVDAAFVDIGAERAGFLHASDVLPPEGREPSGDAGLRRRSGVVGLPLSEVLREGQPVLVQVTRDGVGTKGPGLTMFVSLPGRWLVLMPSLERIGISRRVADPAERERARAALESLQPPPGMGFIVRTAGAGRGAEDLRRDYDALMALHGEISARAASASPPTCLRREGGLLPRTLRDWLAEDVAEIVVDTTEGADEARAFLEKAAPERVARLRRHGDGVPLFHAEGIEEAVDRLFERRVPLPGGGFLLVEPTEALVAIDVNSGRNQSGRDLEATALTTDLLAAPEIARQVRLRDLGGLIIVDFIDVRDPAHRGRVDAAVAEAFAGDRARVRIAPMSEFGIVQITRRRSGPSHRQRIHTGCPSCRGRGIVRTTEAAALRALREVRARLAGGERGLVLRAVPEVAAWLHARRGPELRRLDAAAPEGIRVVEDRDLPPSGFEVR